MDASTRGRRFLSTLFAIVLLHFCAISQFQRSAILGTEYVSSIVADSSCCYAATYSDGLYRSSDHGAHWDLVNYDLSAQKGILSLLIRANSLYIGTSGNGVYRSDDSGATAIPMNEGLLLPIMIWSMASTDSSVYAGSYGGAVYRYDRWDNRWWETEAHGLILSMAASSSKVFAATGAGHIYRSSDHGLSWSFLDSGLTNQHIIAVGFDGERAFAASNGYGIIDEFRTTGQNDVFMSTDDGASWHFAGNGISNQTVRCFATLARGNSGTRVFAGTSNGVLLWSDDSTKWLDVSDGLPNEGITSLAIAGSYLLAGTFTGSIWRRPLTEIITTVKRYVGEPPNGISLAPNYPNPFNSLTRLRITLRATAFTTVQIHDVLGRNVSTLIAEVLQPGNHDISFNATDLPSGVYFCRLATGGTVLSRTLTLIK